MEVSQLNGNGNIADNQTNNVAIRVKNLKVWTPEEKSWWRKKPSKPSINILNGISECIYEGEFLAVLGPSGGGKTTFLVSLAGKCNLLSSGTVTVRGQDARSLQTGYIEIVPQFEVYTESFTVWEHLIFMTEMKLGSSNKPSNRATLGRLIQELKLKNLLFTEIRSLSGGERRLLSLATSLLSSPQILVCDEPTTGLDSYNAALVISTLKSLSKTGQIVICSVHQPSSDIFMEFSSIMLIAEGKLLFHGTQGQCKSMFDSLSLRCPKNYNPAEFYVSVVSSADGAKFSYTDKIEKAYQQTGLIANGVAEDPPSMIHAKIKISQRNWFTQVYLLLWRSWLQLKRTIGMHIFRFICSVSISTIAISLCYSGTSGKTQQGVQDIRGLLWLMTSEVLFILEYSALFAFHDDLTLFKREVGIYSSSACYIARLLGLIPRAIIWPVTCVGIGSMFVELPQQPVTVLELVLVLLMAGIPASAYGLGMSALFTSSGWVQDLTPCIDTPLFIMAGTFMRVSSIPLWIHPVKYLSHFYYAMDAMNNIVWRKVDHIECNSTSENNCYKDGAAVLFENGYSVNYLLLDPLGLLLISILWISLGYYGLKREEKKGFAY